MKPAVVMAGKIIFALIFLNISLHGVTSSSPEAQLQVIVKERPAHCPIRSEKGDILHMHYTGTLDDGSVFDSSYSRDSPLTFTLGAGEVIRGWDQGLTDMCEGEVRQLIIPPQLAYGKEGAPPLVPQSATLTFTVSLVTIERMIMTWKNM